jgi:sorbitol-specific phosphotransferase system component IIA
MALSGKSSIIFFWGMMLIVAHGFVNGDFQDLYCISTNTLCTQANPPGLLLRLGGEAFLFVILIVASEISDTAGDLSLAFLGGLTLLFLVTNANSLSGWISTLSGGTL